MKITTVLNGHVLIRPRKATPAPAGIDIPESVDKERETVGEVLVGRIESGNLLADPVVTPGAVVLFSSLSPRKVTHDGEECLIIHGEDILAVVTE